MASSHPLYTAALAACLAGTLHCSSSTKNPGTSTGGSTGTGGSPASGSSTSSGSTSSTSGASSSGASSSSSSSSGSSTSSSSSSSSGSTAAGKWVVGYYASWTDPANGGNYPVSAIDWAGLTHVATAFYLPDGNGGWASGTFDSGTATSIISAAHTNGKKAIASIGGASSATAFDQSTTSANLSKFVDALAALVAMGYDGVDIDWEGSTSDTAQQLALAQAIRAKMPSAILTWTAGSENENFPDDLTWYATLAASVDQINIMSYGMSGAYSGWDSWHSSPLHWNNVSSTPAGIDATVGHYLAAGVPAAKLGVGSGFYGMCYTSPVTAPAQPLNGSTIAADDNTMSYANIMASYYAQSAYHYDSAAEAPYLTLNGSNGQHCTYVTYEDATSIAAKGAWVKQKGLGGVIIWQLAEGYVSSGSGVAAQNPLLEAMKTSFIQ